MKKSISFLIGLFLIVPFLLADGGKLVAENSLTETKAEPAWLSYLEGEVYLNFEEAEINLIIRTADGLKTANGRVEVSFRGNYIRLDKYTEIIFAALEDNFILLRIMSGNVYLRVKNEISIQTPHKQDTFPVGSYLIEVGTDKTNIYSNPKVPFNNFLSWNFRRNDELARRVTQRYLPDSLADYEYLLYRYGSWRYYSPYGYVWIPRVNYGWRPYFYGRWIWYSVFGWTWISYEPFGWCVYHYGRWQRHPSWGWYWIPTREWGPAWVYWHRYTSYCGWAPLWYDRIYYQSYRSYYDYTYGRAWTVVHKSQLSSRNIAKHVVSKTELKKRIPQNILISPTNNTSRSKFRKTYSPNRAKIADRPTTRVYSPGKITGKIISRNSYSKSSNYIKSRSYYTSSSYTSSSSRLRSSKISSRSSVRKSFSRFSKSVSRLHLRSLSQLRLITTKKKVRK